MGSTSKCFQSAAEAAESSAWSLSSAAEALEKALEAEDQEKQELATSWKNSATQHQVAANWHQQAAEAISQADSEKGARFKTAADAASSSAWSLFSASNALENALEAEAQGKQELATSWKNSTTQYQVAADWWRQAAEALFEGDREKGERCKTAAEAAEKEADRLKETAQNHK